MGLVAGSFDWELWESFQDNSALPFTGSCGKAFKKISPSSLHLWRRPDIWAVKEEGEQQVNKPSYLHSQPTFGQILRSSVCQSISHGA